MKSLVDESFQGRWKVPAGNLDLSFRGRPLRPDGVARIRQSIMSNGWVDTRIIACRLAGDNGVLDEATAKTKPLRVIDGRHRCAALVALNAAKDSGQEICPLVDVHSAVDADTERLIAGAQDITEAVVKTTLFDRVRSTKAALQGCSNTRSKPLAVEGLASGSGGSRENAKKSVANATEALKQAGLDALEDVTVLEGRPAGHRELNPSPDGLHFERVTLEALLRPEFAAMPGEDQAAYIYRMASGFKIGKLTEDDFRELDGAASATGRVVRSVSALVGRQDWTPGFNDFIRRVTPYEPYSQFISHHHALDEACTIHARSLPDGMQPHTPLNEFQLSRPWQPILQEMKKYEAMESFPEILISKEKQLREDAASKVEEFNQKIHKRQRCYSADEASEVGQECKVKIHKEGQRAARTKASETAAASAACAPPSTANEVAADNMAVRRRLLSRLLAIDVFCPYSVGDLDGLHSLGIRYTLTFLNLSRYVSVPAGTSVSCSSSPLNQRLQTALDSLSKNLENHGTVLLSVPGEMQETNLLTDMFNKAGLRVEGNPVISTHAGSEGRGGQSSITVVAHKDGERFICNPGGRNSNEEGETTHTPRASRPPYVQRHVDAALDPRVGKWSCRAPAEGSFISSALTTFFITRYTDRDDAVLTTDAAVDSTVCEKVLYHGRSLVALVLAFGKVELVRQKVGQLEEDFKCGWPRPWLRVQRPINIPDSNVPRSVAPRVWVSRDKRPMNVPHSNVPREVALEVAWRQPQHAPHVISPEQQVAAMAAKEMGLEIKASNRHGLGLFAQEDMAAGDAMPMVCFGSFVVHDSLEVVVSAINKDGVPRHHVTSQVYYAVHRGGEQSSTGRAVHGASPVLLLVVHELKRLGRRRCQRGGTPKS
ncbi:expressed unknown protein [Ectocarpus siliculosus]|uniref:Uncharacterized protein n=1 Tax=Ectocarpus siliculosus TaxID=2880 RepID=D7G2F3_ECTSI|nr:expressed unknown protein [Ectocarpus siliculosus]|eukprot:CBJ33387.1 expressed unknown protein [Ectocarpus siliculosus]